MKIFVAILLACLYSDFVSGQETMKIYYDKNWEITASPDYLFYRIINYSDNKINVEDYYRGGHIQMRGSYTSLEPKEIKSGHFVYYNFEGVITKDEYYQNDLKEGESMEYDALTGFKYKMHYKKGKLEDTLTGYYPNGAVRRIEVYSKDSLSFGHCYDKQGNEIKFFPRQISPAYPGGEREMMKFIQQNTIYPETERSKGNGGRIVVKFTVDLDGSVTDIKIKKSLSPSFDKEAMRVIAQFPKFKPALLEGKPAGCELTIPIVFNPG